MKDYDGFTVQSELKSFGELSDGCVIRGGKTEMLANHILAL